MKEEYVIRTKINDHILRCSKLIFFYVSCRMGRLLIWIDYLIYWLTVLVLKSNTTQAVQALHYWSRFNSCFFLRSHIYLIVSVGAMHMLGMWRLTCLKPVTKTKMLQSKNLITARPRVGVCFNMWSLRKGEVGKISWLDMVADGHENMRRWVEAWAEQESAKRDDWKGSPYRFYRSLMSGKQGWPQLRLQIAMDA